MARQPSRRSDQIDGRLLDRLANCETGWQMIRRQTGLDKLPYGSIGWQSVRQAASKGAFR
jgi:hypothetical protein